MDDRGASMSIRLAIVDDHPLIAAAIEAATTAEARAAVDALDSRIPIRVVGVARDVAAGRALAGRSGPDAPDVVLCDIQLAGDADGLEVVRAASAAGSRPIVLTAYERASFMREAFELGALGFIAKDADVGDILAAVRTVFAGGSAFPAAVLDAARDGPRVPSAREREVLALLRRGASNDEIGGALKISPRTVESHLRRLFDRYGVLSRTELVVLAMAEGWVGDARA
jgi:DNA-binding NarL/FixJ family response regulator